LKANESQIGQRYEDVESKREYYQVTIFPEETKKSHQELQEK
jgi:hypothetical protein